MKRIISTVLVFAMLFGLLAGCIGSKDGKNNSSASATDGGQKKELNIEDNTQEEVKEELKEATPKEIFNLATVEVMKEIRSMGSSFGLSVVDTLGLPKDITSYPSVDITINSKDKSDGTEAQIRQLVMQNGAEAMHKFINEADGQKAECGVYFQGDSMLVQQADKARPLIKYNLPEGDGERLSRLAPMNRYLACLIQDKPGETWVPLEENMQYFSMYLDEYGEDIAMASRTLSAGSLSAEAKSYTLNATGELAGNLFFPIYSGLIYDFEASRVICAIDNVALADGDQLCTISLSDVGVMNTDDLELGIEVCTVDDVPAGLFLNAKSKGGTVQIEMTKLVNGSDSAARLFTTYTHEKKQYLDKKQRGGYTALMENSTVGGVQDSTQLVCDPDGKERLKYACHTEMSGSKENQSGEFKISYKDDTLKLKSNGSYSRTSSEDSTSVEFKGSTTTVQKTNGEESQEKATYEGTATAERKEGKIEFPEVVDGSAEIADTREELSNKMAPEDKYSQPFNSIASQSPYTQLLYGYMYMMIV